MVVSSDWRDWQSRDKWILSITIISLVLVDTIRDIELSFVRMHISQKHSFEESVIWIIFCEKNIPFSTEQIEILPSRVPTKTKQPSSL